MKKFNVMINVMIVLCVVITSLVTMSGCDNEDVKMLASQQSDTLRVIKGYQYEPSLIHSWDSVYKVKVTDDMNSKLEIWRTEEGQKLLPSIFSNEEHPQLIAYSTLAREDYAITQDQVNITASSSTIIRRQKLESDGTMTETDTVRFWFPDGQILSIPVTITRKKVEIAEGSVFDYPSLTLVKAEFSHLINNQTGTRNRAASTYVSAEYDTEYKALLTLKEINLEDPQTFVIPVYAYTNRRVLSDNEIEKIIIDNKNRVWVDTLTERCSFDKITVYKNGEKTQETKDIILNHLFKGIEPYDKYVGSFDYTFKCSNGIANGSEAARESGVDGWSVWGKTDKYSSNLENGVVDDKVVTNYTLYHERAIYREDTITVDFSYITPEVQEITTSVTGVKSDKTGYKKAELKNFIGTTYLGGVQALNELVNLYMTSKDIIGYDIINPKIKVIKDSVIADLDFVTKFENGSESKVHDHFSAPRSLKCNTSWESIQEILSQITDTACIVTMSGSEDKTKGYWRYSNETRNISNYAHLYNGETKLNNWTSVVPNKLYYVREGKSYTFEVLPYAIKEQGAALNLRGKESNYTVYDYTDLITENFGGYTQTSSAPGVVKIADITITGYEVRNKLLTITPEYVKASLDFVTIFSNGTQDVEKVEKEFARSLICTTDWKATEQNSNETTYNPSAQLAASQNMTENEWSWVNQTRSISASVKLNASTQYNGWTAMDPNSIKYTRNGVVADFGTINHSVVKVVDNVTLSGTEGLTETYKYNNTINVNYGNNTQSTTAPGTIIVNKQKEIIGHEFRNGKLVIANTNVTASLTYVTKYNDGSEEEEAVSKVFPRTLNCYTNWTSNEDNASVLTGSANVLLTGSNYEKDGNWSYTTEKRKVTTIAKLNGSSQNNGWEASDPNSIVYTRDGESYRFNKIEFTATESGQSVNLTSETATLSTYSYTDLLTVNFGDNVQSITALGTILVKKEKKVIGYEIRDKNLLINHDNVLASLTFVTMYNDGSEDKEVASKEFARSLICTTDWSSNEDNANQNTGSASVTLKNTENKTDGDWSYTRETRGINTTATLNGSSQNNGWESNDPNNITFSRNGKSYSFGTLNFSAQETGANVNKVSENDNATVYSYTDNISVSFGSNTFTSTAPGKITVAAPWNPDFDFGPFTSCVFTTAVAKTRNTWTYIASVHFEQGTLPLIIGKDANAPEVNLTYFENNTDSRLNSATWLPGRGKWVNTIATDTPDVMEWNTTSATNADNLPYPTATAWGWDYGYTVKGHPSVTTDKFSAEISHNGYMLTIYKQGKVFATYKAKK